jgi:organic radical activating enzyme
MPQGEYIWLPREELLTFEEIASPIDVFTSHGVEDVHLTGGEPLLRPHLAKLVEMLAANPRLPQNHVVPCDFLNRSTEPVRGLSSLIACRKPRRSERPGGPPR